MTSNCDVTNSAQSSYQFAVYLHKKLPPSWENNELAEEDWRKGFRHRNKTLNLRSPEVRQIPLITFPLEKLSLVLTKKVIVMLSSCKDLYNHEWIYISRKRGRCVSFQKWYDSV